MSYRTIQPPFSLKFREMAREDLKSYAHWYLEAIPQRVAELARAIRQSEIGAGWESNFSPTSLESLGNWFAIQVEMRQRTDDEFDEIESRSQYPIEIADEELTNRTFSLAVDVGMYLSQVLLKNYPSLRWEQLLDNKKFADYGQPVIVGFGPVPLNPVRIAITLAYGIATKKQTGKRLRELYDYWSNQVRSKV